MLSQKKSFAVKIFSTIIILLVGISFLQKSIDLQRKFEDLEANLLLMPGEIAGSLILSGFRGIGADLLWLQVHHCWHSGQQYRMLPLFNSITFLQPHFITPWAVGGWHMAYNIYVLMKTEKEKNYWLQTGLNFLKRGTEHNPNRYDLYFELAWTYYHKAKDYANAVKYFEKAVKFPHPEYVDDCLAHAYAKNGQIKKSIKTWEDIIRNNSGFKEVDIRIIRNLKTYGTENPPEKKEQKK